MHLGHAAQPEITAAAVELLTDFRLRPAVEEKAEMFGCLEAVFDLTIIDAVRLLQQKEQYIPCFGGESPLVPLPDGYTPPEGVGKEKLCGVFECCWRLSCDMLRIMQAGSPEKCHDER